MDDLGSRMQELLSDPESMQQLSELAAMLQGESGEAPKPQENAAGAALFDPKLLMHLTQLMQTQQPDKNAALLLALKPHLGQRRQQRTDQAIRLLRLYGLWKAAKQSGMLHDLI
jgi:hypothetical protein